MRLINASTHALEEYFNDIPAYAILSHTWGEGEVTLQDWQDLEKARLKKGFWKIEQTCAQAKLDGYQYAWVDTCCIDKTSSSELSEAINSMFEWYSEAKVCYAYLEDVDIPSAVEGEPHRVILRDAATAKAFRASRWFRRGWTLQELLAPTSVRFYSCTWKHMFAKREAADLISDLTGIDATCMRKPAEMHRQSVACRMSWMAHRETTRVEDTAYCMLGIFGLHMPLLYGEGHNAFLRLQHEIIRISSDQTLFCWQDPRRYGARNPSDPSDALHRGASKGKYNVRRAEQLLGWASILAPDPTVFADTARYRPYEQDPKGRKQNNGVLLKPEPYEITNFGLRISLPLLYTGGGVYAVLDVVVVGNQSSKVLIPLRQHRSDRYHRFLPSLLTGPVPLDALQARQPIYVDCNPLSLGFIPSTVWDAKVDGLPRRLFFTFSHPVAQLETLSFGDLEAPIWYCATMPSPDNSYKNAGGVFTVTVNDCNVLVLIVGYQGELLLHHVIYGYSGGSGSGSGSGGGSGGGAQNPSPQPKPEGEPETPVDLSKLWYIGTTPGQLPQWMHGSLLQTRSGLEPSDVGTWPLSLGIYGCTTWTTDEGDEVCHLDLASSRGAIYKTSTWSKNRTESELTAHQLHKLKNIRMQIYERFAAVDSSAVSDESWSAVRQDVIDKRKREHGHSQRFAFVEVGGSITRRPE